MKIKRKILENLANLDNRKKGFLGSGSLKVQVYLVYLRNHLVVLETRLISYLYLKARVLASGINFNSPKGWQGIVGFMNCSPSLSYWNGIDRLNFNQFLILTGIYTNWCGRLKFDTACFSADNSWGFAPLLATFTAFTCLQQSHFKKYFFYFPLTCIEGYTCIGYFMLILIM